MNIIILSGKNHATLEFLEPVLRRLKKGNSDFRFHILLSHRNQNILFPWVERFQKEGLIETFQVGPSMPRSVQAIMPDINVLMWLLGLLFFPIAKYIKKLRPQAILLESSLVPESKFLNLFALYFSRKTIKRNFLIPHSPHYTGVVRPITYLKKHINSNFELWLPRKGDKVEGYSKEVSVTLTGYPAFDTQVLRERRETMAKNEQKSDLLYMIREWRGHHKHRFHSSYDSIKKVSAEVLLFAREMKMKTVTIKPHPSIKNKEMEVFLNDINASSYELEINISRDKVEALVPQETLVIGFFTSVLLSTALLGLQTILIDDNLIEDLRKNDKDTYNLYKHACIMIPEDEISLLKEKINYPNSMKKNLITKERDWVDDYYLSDSIDICINRLMLTKS